MRVDELREQICDLGRRMWQRDFAAGCDGNISIRLGNDRFLATPTGMSKGLMQPQDICLIDAEGQLAETNAHDRRTTSEIGLHLAIYAARSDVHAVIHAHPPFGTAWACCGQPLPGNVHPEAVYFLGPVPTAPYHLPGTPAVGQSVAKLLQPDTTCVLLQNHGVVCFGPTLLEAYHNLEMLERYCQVLTHTRNIGSVRELTETEREELLRFKTQS